MELHDTDHYECFLTPIYLRDMAGEMITNLGETFADLSILPIYVIPWKITKKLKLTLSDDSIDQLFTGYNKYMSGYLSKYYTVIPCNNYT